MLGMFAIYQIWDSGSNVVNECCAHGILTDGECKIAATFSEKSIAEFEGYGHFGICKCTWKYQGINHSFLDFCTCK